LHCQIIIVTTTTTTTTTIIITIHQKIDFRDSHYIIILLGNSTRKPFSGQLSTLVSKHNWKIQHDIKVLL